PVFLIFIFTLTTMTKSCQKMHSYRMLFALAFPIILLSSCASSDKAPDLRIHIMDSAKNVELVKSVEGLVKPMLAEDLTMKLWATDSMVISPIAIDVDDMGRLYYTTTDRQKNSEFDIRAHSDWELESIALQSIEDKRAFLHKTLSPE